jgi:MFS family permease
VIREFVTTRLVRRRERAAADISRAQRLRTLFALAFGYFIDQGEGQAMSVLFPTLQQVWGLSYTNLGTIGTIRSALQALSAPLWGYASDRFSRKQIIIFGTGVWGVWTALVGLTQNFQQLLIIRAVSGIGLGCLLPATFSIMADTFPPRLRGRALGVMEGIGVLGIIVGTFGLGFLAYPHLWRWGFLSLGAFSIVSGLVVALFVKEPVRGASEPELAGKVTEENASRYTIQISDVVRIARIPTFWVAIVQGLAGSMPWVVLGLYLITWMVRTRGMTEALDFSNPQGSATLAFIGIVIGTVFSNVLGGVLGDWADRLSPKYGRTFIGQLSVFSGIPLSYVMLTQTENWAFWPFFFLCFATALLISWPGKGAKEPMLQATVPPELRSTAFALMTAIESGFAALAAFIAGRLADTIGFTEALVWTIPFPWIICFLLFSLFYWSYPRDAARMRALMRARAEELT